MSTDTIGGFLHPGNNVIDTLQPEHAHSLAARVRELEAALRDIECACTDSMQGKTKLVGGFNCAQLLKYAASVARRALRGGAA